MILSLLRLLFVPASALLFLAASADARPVDCSAEGQAGASRCLIATERVQPGRDPLSSGASMAAARAPVPAAALTPVGWWFDRPAAAPNLASEDDVPAFAPESAGPTDESPWLAMLLATVCIVAFMAHRRGGG